MATASSRASISARLSPNGRVLNTYQTMAAALGSAEPSTPGSRRFIIDFAGGDLAYFLADPQLVEVVPSTSQGTIMRSFIVPNPHTKGFRAVDRRPARSRPIHGSAGFPAHRRARADRDLDVSVA